MKSGRQILWVLYNWGRLTTFKFCNRRKLLKVLLKINNNIKHFPSSPYKNTNNAFLQFYGKVTGATRGIFSVVRTIKLFFDEKKTIIEIRSWVPCYSHAHGHDFYICAQIFINLPLQKPFLCTWMQKLESKFEMQERTVL